VATTDSFRENPKSQKTQRVKSMTMTESFITATREERAQRADTGDSLVTREERAQRADIGDSLVTREERAQKAAPTTQKATPTTINTTKDRPCLLKSLRYNTILPHMPSARLEVSFWSITIIVIQNSKSEI